MKLAKVSIDNVLKVIFWICRAYVNWYWSYSDMPFAEDLNAWLYPTNTDIKRWNELKEMEKRGEI